MELIVVIVTILILSAAAIPVWMHFIGQATSARDINNTQNVLTATQLTVADSFTNSLEVESGEYVNRHVKNSYQALTNIAPAPSRILLIRLSILWLSVQYRNAIWQ